VIANVHARVDPDAQGLLGVGIVLQPDGIHKAVCAFQVVGLQLGCQRGGDSGALITGRQGAC
jgi:hypothetical protein